ncbi:MAG: ABC transporter ATP-binding protein [Gammaproteobacteria bacterium]|nr:MAG: ABC transporter ATP-binding protein [Gammaproteobacteria bacterium]
MIELIEVCRDYVVGDQVVHALDHVSLRIPAGDYVSIMGPSGSGKSTLLNILGLMDRPTAGIYRLDGVDTSTMNDEELAHARQHQIGFVFQSFHLVPRLNALENVELPMILAGIPPKQRHSRSLGALAKVGLSKRADHRPNQLSGGERQRVAIARAIVMQPKLLLADEPTGNLDSKSGGEIIAILEQLNGQGLTVLVVTHDPAIGGRARRQLQFRDGRLLHDSGQS